MSSSSFSSSLSGFAQGLASTVRELLQSVQESHAEAISPAQAQVNACQITMSSADGRLRAARASQQAATKAKTLSDLPAVASAAQAAQTELEQAELEHSQAQSALVAAQANLKSALIPTVEYTGMLVYLDKLTSISEGYHNSTTLAALALAKSALTKAKASHQQIGEAENRVDQCRTALDSAATRLERAQGAKALMQSAVAADRSASNLAGAQAATDEVVHAEQAKSLANHELVEAESKLKEALQPVQAHLELVKELETACQLSTKADSEYWEALQERRRASSREEEAAVSSSNDDRRDSPCTCCETDCPCSYCRSEQQAWAGGHRRETGMCD